MSKIQTMRAAIENEQETKLLMVLGATYVQWIKEWLLRDRNIARYLFAYIFEQNDLGRETGVHRHITDISIGDEAIAMAASGKGWPVAATLDIKLRAYDKLRRSSRSRNEPSFPKFQTLGG